MSLLNVNKIKPYNDGTSVTIEAADVFVSGTLEVSGTIKSYALETIVTSETTYLGSNKFGNDATDTHQFTGSIHGLIASSLEVKDSRLSLTDTDVVHGVTNVAATDVYGDFGPIHSTYGGLMINGLSDQENAGARSLALRGICNDTHTDTVPTVEIIGAKRSGATVQALDAAETVLQVANHSTVLVNVLGNGSVLPGADNSYDLGSSTYKWANVYTGDLHLKNDRGDWTILEEEDYLCVVNNKSGKKYKMMLQEIDD